MTDLPLLKSLTNPITYAELSPLLAYHPFKEDAKSVFELIKSAHEQAADANLNASTLMAIWQANNPLATRSAKENAQDYISAVFEAEDIPPDIAKDVLYKAFKREFGLKLANLGLRYSEGDYSVFSEIERLVDGRQTIERTQEIEPASTDLDDLLDINSDERRYAFPIASLKRHCYGLAASEFGIIFATPETGKTAFAVTLMASPGGYADQGLRTLYLGNEEKCSRTMLRAYSCYLGMPKADLLANKITAKQRFASVADKIVMMDAQGFTLDDVGRQIERIRPDVVICDQLDKVSIPGTFAASHEKFRELYLRTRELAKKHDVALWGVSQASNDAANKTRLSLHEMEGSRIGKAAEADLIIGIGKASGADDDPARYITFCKNKVSGVHESIVCSFDGKISRYSA